MRYPTGNKIFYRQISHANRGMILEELINTANKFYRENKIALIYKKPTPIGIVSVKSEGRKKIITKAFFKEPSTLDYNGIYKGRYIEFDAKETKSKTSFPLANISVHQIEHIKNVINHMGVAFLVISINNEYYLVEGTKIISYINNNNRKSIPYHEIKNIGYKINSNGLIIVDYIKKLDNIIGGLQNEITKKTSERKKS